SAISVARGRGPVRAILSSPRCAIWAHGTLVRRTQHWAHLMARGYARGICHQRFAGGHWRPEKSFVKPGHKSLPADRLKVSRNIHWGRNTRPWLYFASVKPLYRLNREEARSSDEGG